MATDVGQWRGVTPSMNPFAAGLLANQSLAAGNERIDSFFQGFADREKNQIAFQDKENVKTKMYNTENELSDVTSMNDFNELRKSMEQGGKFSIEAIRGRRGEHVDPAAIEQAVLARSQFLATEHVEKNTHDLLLQAKENGWDERQMRNAAMERVKNSDMPTEISMKIFDNAISTYTKINGLTEKERNQALYEQKVNELNAEYAIQEHNTSKDAAMTVLKQDYDNNNITHQETKVKADISASGGWFPHIYKSGKDSESTLGFHNDVNYKDANIYAQKATLATVSQANAALEAAVKEAAEKAGVTFNKKALPKIGIDDVEAGYANMLMGDKDIPMNEMTGWFNDSAGPIDRIKAVTPELINRLVSQFLSGNGEYESTKAGLELDFAKRGAMLTDALSKTKAQGLILQK